MAGKSDIVDFIADNVEGISKKQANEAFESFVEVICMHLERGERVQVPGLGSLAGTKRATPVPVPGLGRSAATQRAARTGRNPKTGEAIQIPASKNVRFKAGKDL